MILTPQKKYFCRKPPMAVRLNPSLKLLPDELRFVIVISFISGFTGGCAAVSAIIWFIT